MKTVVERVVAGLPFDGPSRRALDETLCDWTYEEAAATTRARRMGVCARSVIGVMRTIVLTIGSEVARIPAGWLLPRLAGFLVVPALVLAATGWGHVAVAMPATSDRWFELTALALPQAALALMPLALFVVAARAPTRQVPALGLAVAAACAVFILSAWLVPAAGRRFHVLAYAMTAAIDPAHAAERLPSGPGDQVMVAVIADAIKRPGGPAMGVVLFRTGLALLAAAFTLWGSAVSRAPAPLRRHRLGLVAGTYVLGIALLPSQWELGAHAPALVGLIPWMASAFAFVGAIRLSRPPDQRSN
jgi:hypothetical protein